MADWLRRAGSGRTEDGSQVTWSVAEGRRGRRWREVIVDGLGEVRSSLLLELDPTGRFSHLELSTAHGLLTLHPEPDGTLHGNAVTPDGLRHVRGVPWHPDRAIRLDGSVVCVAAARRPDGSWAESFLWIEQSLAIGAVGAPVDRALVDDAGLPRLHGGTTWPLEASD